MNNLSLDIDFINYIASLNEDELMKAIESKHVTTEQIKYITYKIYPSQLLSQSKINGIPWNLYEYQIDLIDNIFTKGINVIIGKQRQQGATELLAGYCAWRVIFLPLGMPENIAIVSKDGGTAQDFIERCRAIYNTLPDFIKASYPLDVKDRGSSKSIRFGNGSRIKAYAATKNPVSGQPLTLGVLDEHAKIEYAEEAYSDIASALSQTGGQLIIQSTGFGLNEQWVKWNLAISNEIDLKPIFIGREWNGKPLIPKRTEKWYEDTRKTFKTEDDFLENYPRTPEEMFKKTGTSAFDQDRLMEWWQGRMEPMLEGHMREDSRGSYYIETNYDNKEFMVWEVPQDNHYYSIGVDVAGGLGEENDATVISVKKLATLSTVAIFYSKHTAPFDAGKIAYMIARYYNNGFVVGEANNQGRECLMYLVRNMNYRNIFKSNVIGREFEEGDERGFGFHTNKESKRELVTEYQHAVHKQATRTFWEKSIKEHMIYINDKGKYRHPPGAHDDCVDADMLAFWGCLNYSKKINNKRRNRTGSYL